MAELPTNVSESTRKRNPHLYGLSPTMPASTAPSKRIRQDAKPVTNKLETEWLLQIINRYPNYPVVRAQAKRYKLGNGIWYKPDFTVSSWPTEDGPAMETAWEVKGPHAFRGGFENLKVAASQWPEVRFILVWKEDGQWKQQIILP